MKTLKTRTIVLILAVVLVFGAAVGGTLALLIDTTETVTNTFTVGSVDIDLDETTGAEYKMIPGVDISKDPKVTVMAVSEECWVFVKIEEANNLDTFIDYTVATGWSELAGQEGVYWRKVSDTAENQTFSVLADDKVTVKDVTADQLNGLGQNLPKLSFTAYAVQAEGIANETLAWAEVNK